MLAIMMRVVVGLVAALVFASSAANAQDSHAAVAQSLFEAGRVEMETGSLDAACAHLRESFRLQVAAGTLLNLAACEERRSHFAVAHQCFRDALALLDAGDYRRAFAEERIVALRQRIASVTLAIQDPVPPLVDIRVNDTVLQATSLGAPLWLDAGEHVLIVNAAGREPARTRIQLKEGETRNVVLWVGPVLSPPRVQAGTPSPTPMPYVLMGTGGAALLAGGILGLMVMDAASDVRAHCDASGCDDAGLDAGQRGRPLAIVSPVLLGAGVALIGGGLYWLLRDRQARNLGGHW